MQIKLEIPDAVFEAALRYTLDPVSHAVNMFDHWAQLAEQANPGVDVLTLPTLAEKQVQHQAEQAKAAQEAEATYLTRQQLEAAEQASQQAEADKQAKAAELQQTAAIEARAMELAKAMMQSLAPKAAK